MALTTVRPATVKFVQQVDCANCSTNINLDNGLPLECRKYTEIESAMLRARALKGNELIESGVMMVMDESLVNKDKKIRKRGINVGPIRTRDSGAASFRECRHNYEGFSIDNFEKLFYTVPTEKKLKICTKEFVGTHWSQYMRNMGASLSDFTADVFANSDMSDILLAAIIEEYECFVPEFTMLSAQNSESENGHGDDGIMSKIWFQSKYQYFHTVEWDLTDFDAAGKALNIRVNGKKLRFLRDDYADFALALTDILDQISALKWKAIHYMFNASGDIANKKLVVASAFATTRVQMNLVINDGEIVDWGCNEIAQLVDYTELVPNMLINDTPLLFNYQEINEQNFAQLFKNYIKEYKRYLHRNGFGNMPMSEMRICIDPELLLEREGQQFNVFLRFNNDNDLMSSLGLGEETFVPVTALNNTGLFLITMRGNLQLLADPDNNFGMIGEANIKIDTVCMNEGDFVRVMFENPLGSDVEHYGLVAANLCGSPHVVHNDLDNQVPLRHTEAILPCFDADVRQRCATSIASCTIAADIDYVATYDDVADETNIVVDVTATSTNESYTTSYSTTYTLSDGTASPSPITTPSFTITLPGNQVDSGLVLTVQTTVQSLDGSDVKCTCNPTETFRIGDGAGVSYTFFSDNVIGAASTNLVVTLDLQGTILNVPLVNTALDIREAADHPEIEEEIEAIIPDSLVTIQETAPGVVSITIEGVSNLYTAITFALVTLTKS